MAAKIRYRIRQWPRILAAACMLTLLILQATALQAASDAAGSGILLNLSGQQRMLTQRLSKEVLLIAMNINRKQNTEYLRRSSHRFDQIHSSLKNGNPAIALPATDDQEILQRLQQVESVWQSFGPVIAEIIASERVTAPQLRFIARENLTLLEATDSVVRLYEQQARREGLSAAPELAATINQAGQQRLLTQKMTKEYLLIARGFQITENRSRLRESYSRFDQVMTGLLNGDETLGLIPPQHPQLRSQLLKVQVMWLNFMPLVKHGLKADNEAISADQVNKIARNNLPLLQQAHRAVQMYQQLAARTP